LNTSNCCAEGALNAACDVGALRAARRTDGAEEAAACVRVAAGGTGGVALVVGVEVALGAAE
jgi:hypothetical protein